MSDFDELAEQTFSQISNLLGEDAVWPASKSKKIPGRVLFKNPTEPVQIGDTERYEYRPSTATAEYYTGTFDGLRQVVDSGGEACLIIRGVKYSVQSIETKFDGNTLVAHLEPVDELQA
ncbi:hypothetical protein [uncultured Rikenella sp.]|uniref:head-tail joining protein n=1 Tax=uncultured Rikenella sp. TaxID=368003 RepID=UPI002605E1C1|nr:hypothetical protein [uncultured Rikenella sp.]